MQANLYKAYGVNRKYYNLWSRLINFEEGETVLRRNFALSGKIAHFNSKLTPKFLRAKVIAKSGNSHYKFSDLDGKEIGVFHAKDMQKFTTFKN